MYSNRTDAGTNTLVTISGLQEGATYYFTVAAYAANGEESAFCNEVSFQVPAAAATPYVTGAKLGTLRNDFSGYAGMRIVVGAQPLTVTALGRLVAPGNKEVHTVKFVSAADLKDVPGAAIGLSMLGGTVGSFLYGELSTPIVLAAGTAYYLVSYETSGGDAWYHWDTILDTTADAFHSGAAWGYPSGKWFSDGLPGQAFVPVDFLYNLPAGNDTEYVTGQTLGLLRNDYTGLVGAQVFVGKDPVSVTALGRMMVAGNSGAHTVKLISAKDGLDVPGASVIIDMASGTAGQFKYASLPAPVSLAPATAYWLVSEEIAGGDTWYNWDTTVTTTTVATNNAIVWGQKALYTYPVSNQMFVPLSFKYSSP